MVCRLAGAASWQLGILWEAVVGQCLYTVHQADHVHVWLVAGLSWSVPGVLLCVCLVEVGRS